MNDCLSQSLGAKIVNLVAIQIKALIVSVEYDNVAKCSNETNDDLEREFSPTTNNL